MVEVPIVMHCGYCGNKTLFAPHGEYEYKEILTNEAYEVTAWVFLQCLTCRKPTLRQTCSLGLKTDREPFETVTSILYPTTQTQLSNLPDAIEKRYKATLKVRNIEPNACAVLAGRTLEAVCKHENAAGRTLADKLNNLAGSDRIPQTLAQMARQLKQLRNLGAHDADDEVTEEDVPIILDFLEAILEYLYVAPAKIAAVQARLNRTSVIIH